MFSIAVFAQDFNNSDFFGKVVDKFSPDSVGKSFGRNINDIIVYGQKESNKPYQNVQILASGSSDIDDLATSFINGVQFNQSTVVTNHVGKTLGSIRDANSGNRFGKAQFQKNWDFNALPTESQASAIYAYLQNQFNITF